MPRDPASRPFRWWESRETNETVSLPVWKDLVVGAFRTAYTNGIRDVQTLAQAAELHARGRNPTRPSDLEHLSDAAVRAAHYVREMEADHPFRQWWLKSRRGGQTMARRHRNGQWSDRARRIHALVHDDGMSRRAVAKLLGITDTSVRRSLKAWEQLGTEPDDDEPPSEGVISKEEAQRRWERDQEESHRRRVEEFWRRHPVRRVADPQQHQRISDDSDPDLGATGGRSPTAPTDSA